MQLTAPRDPGRVARGDWQTPLAICEAVVARAEEAVGGAPGTVIEPTCGDGAFLVAAAARWPAARLLGFEVDAAHAAIARARLAGTSATIAEASAFEVDFERAIAGLPDPILALGNPPWVTLSTLGAIGADNQPPRARPAGMAGLDAITGRGGFDLAEWIAIRLARAIAGRRGAVALLCKAAAARRVIARAAAGEVTLAPGAIHRLDARRAFRAAVDAALFTARIAPSPAGARWPVHPSIAATTPEAWIGVEGGALVADAAAFERTRHLGGVCSPEWRSGLKHDCAAVMELASRGGALWNGLGERVVIEPDHAFPLLKSTDVARGRLDGGRFVVVPQRALGEDPARLAVDAPATWAYLEKHRARLDARRSRVYRGRPPFSIFGVGPYAFAPFKVAVSGLHGRVAFAVVGPVAGRPVMLDDTCYFLPYADEPSARRAAAALSSPVVADFFRGRLFPDEKRPVTKALLQSLDLASIVRA